MKATPVIPAEIHGFSVKVAMGPYPIDAPQTHRKAMYAELRPVAPEVTKRMRYIGRERILGTAPLTPEAAAEVKADPSGAMAEATAQAALRQAARLAKEVASA